MGLATLAWEPALLDAIGSRRRCSPRSARSSEVYGHGVGDLAGVPIAGDPRRPAGGAVRPDLLRGGRGQVHLRHGLLHADAHGRAPGPLRGTGSSRRSPRDSATAPATYALEGSVAVAGSLIQLAARQPRDHRRRGRGRGARPFRAGQRRRRVRAGLLRAVRAALAVRRARRHRRPDPLRDAGPHRPGRARGRRPTRSTTSAMAMVADLGAALPGGAARGRRDDPQRAADAVPGGHPRPAGRRAADRRDERRSARPTRRAWRSGSGAASTSCGRWTAPARRWEPRDGRGDPRSRDRALAQGRRADARLGRARHVTPAGRPRRRSAVRERGQRLGDVEQRADHGTRTRTRQGSRVDRPSRRSRRSGSSPRRPPPPCPRSRRRRTSSARDRAEPPGREEQQVGLGFACFDVAGVDDRRL